MDKKDAIQDSQDEQVLKRSVQSDRQFAYKKEAFRDITEFAETRKDEMQKLIDDFNKKWPIGLMWDSKVPEKDKWLFYFFSLQTSDKQAVTQAIEKYLNLYKDIYDIKNMKDANDEESINNAYDKIQDLYDELTNMVKKAEIEKETTSSSTVYNLHKDMISRKTQIVKKLERVELSISRQQIQGLTNKLKSALKVCDENKEQINTLQQENKEIKEECKKVIEENKTIREDMRNLMQAISIYMEQREADLNNADEQGESSSQQQQYAQSANGQQESGVQASDIEPNQQQKSNVQVTSDQASQQKESGTEPANDSNVPSKPRSRSSSVSSTGSSNGNQLDPSSKLRSLCSNDSASDIEIISNSQCR